jgi:hypothetical protein
LKCVNGLSVLPWRKYIKMVWSISWRNWTNDSAIALASQIKMECG